MCAVVFLLRYVIVYRAGIKFHHMYYLVFQKYIKSILSVVSCVLHLWTFLYKLTMRPKLVNYKKKDPAFIPCLLPNSVPPESLWICRCVSFWACATAGIRKSLVISLSLCICLSSFWHLIFFTLSQFLLPSLRAAPHYQNSWYSSLANSPPPSPPPSLSLPSSSLSLPSRSHLISPFPRHVHVSYCPEISAAPMTNSLLTPFLQGLIQFPVIL